MPPTNTLPPVVTLNVTTTDKKSSPIQQALQSTRTTVESLHQSQQPQINSFIEKIINHLHILAKYGESTKRINEESFIPRSLRFKFELTTSDIYKESTKFKDLQQKAKDIITTCQQELKQLVSTTKKLEIYETYVNYIKLIYKACSFHIKMTYMEHKMDLNNLYNVMRRIINLDEMTALYTTLEQTVTMNNLMEGCYIVKPDDYIPALDNELIPLDLIIQENIINMFINPKKVYEAAVIAKQHDLELEKFARTTTLEQKADEVALILENDQAIDRVTLDKIINESINKKLTTHLNKIQNNNGNKSNNNGKNNGNSNAKNNVKNNNNYAQKRPHDEVNGKSNKKQKATTNYQTPLKINTNNNNKSNSNNINKQSNNINKQSINKNHQTTSFSPKNLNSNSAKNFSRGANQDKKPNGASLNNKMNHKSQQDKTEVRKQEFKSGTNKKNTALTSSKKNNSSSFNNKKQWTTK
jgi:hypothetical protein